MGEINKIFPLVLRRPFAAGLVILSAIIIASLCASSLSGVITWGNPAGLENASDPLSQMGRPATVEAIPSGLADSRPMPKHTADFSLIDQDGQTVTLSGLRGKVVVVNFIFTQCAEICLQITRELQGLQTQFKTKMGRDLVFLSITLDPQHDSRKVLKEYGRKHSIDFSTWRLLTGSPEEIEAVRSGFGVYAEKVKPQADHLDFLHTAKAYVIDRDGTVAEMLQPGVLTLFGAAAIERVLKAPYG